MRIITALFLTASFVAAVSSAQAARRGISKGDWHTGEFSDPAYIAHWGYGDDGHSKNDFSVDHQQLRDGKATTRLDTAGGGDNWAYFPNTGDLDLDVWSADAFKFWIKSQTKDGKNPPWSRDDLWVIFYDMSGKRAYFDGTDHRISQTLKDWTEITVPVAQHVDTEAAKNNWKVTIDDGFSWRHIAYVEIHAAIGGPTIKWYSGVRFVAEQPVKWWLSSLDKPDLSVTYAEQLPRYKRIGGGYQGDLDALKHWPDPGEMMKYIVHVKNVGFKRSEATDFLCTIDGKTVKTAKVPALAPRHEILIEVPWSWKQGPYQFIASVDTKNKLDEISKKNNTLDFKTDAYKLVAVCEKAVVEPVDKVASFYNSFSFEDWMRGATVDQMNALFRHSKYDFAPNGAEITVRLDKIFLVDEIPDDGEKIQKIDKSLALDDFDGVWHYPLRAAGEWCGRARTYDWALIHELTHQLGIIDNYCMDTSGDRNKINGKPWMHGEGGIMGGGQIGNNTQPTYADIDVAGMNITKGVRRGYYGEYLYCIPMQNTLVLSVAGKPLADAEVKVYQRNMHTQNIEGPSTQEGKTDPEGKFALANRPIDKERTTITNCPMHANPFGQIDFVGRNGVLFIRAKASDGKFYYGYIDIGRFVCEYARGHKDSATYSIEMKAE